MYEGTDFNEQKCPVCGKTFCVLSPGDWTYKKGYAHAGPGTRKFYCSWGCMREAEQQKEKPKRKKGCRGMEIAKLIAKLQEIQEKHGPDVDCYIRVGRTENPATRVTFIPESDSEYSGVIIK